ncbi:unnamed protein product [Peronospora belbahrii]|uniref:Origin recognition complex subunit 3 N-terminal domain-containing protein n=1 Tax=Peronospora belbahrii TaxID=622444 RepID=A0AAU9L3L9_9STRA|nr:unnamed protein product [Peronospora belbahrii]
MRFFEKYCTRKDSRGREKAVTGTRATRTLPAGQRLRDYNAPVLFPEYHAFPTAAVITGTDATSSNLWIQPLMQKLRRTFPLCVLVPRDVINARRFIEWLAAKLAKLCDAKQKEEQWLEGLVEHFDLLPLDKPPVALEKSGRGLTRHEQAKIARVTTGMVCGKEWDEIDERSDDSSYDSSFASEESSNDTDFGSSGRKKRKRRLVPVLYRRWTISKLLSTIKRDSDVLLSPTCGNTCSEWVAMLGELVHDRLQEALTWVKKLQEKEEEMVFWSIACFDEAVVWLQRKIVTAQDTAAKLLNAAPEVTNRSTFHVGITEMALAVMLQRVFRQYVSFLEECTIDRNMINDRRRSVKQKMLNHENHYSLKSHSGIEITTPAQASGTPQPFLLLCIEQLEAFSQQVFGDFLDIWEHFVRQQHNNSDASTMSGTLGFVIGVASATSPALRRLDLAVTNRLELQFFSLVDSQKCFDDVLESLVVKSKLPFSYSGEVLRAIASRHVRVPSVPRLLLTLRYLLFTHFKRCPWSFLALAVNDVPSSGESPILVAADIAPLPHRVSVWIKRHRRNLTREAQGRSAGSRSSLALWLASCSAFELRDLESRVMPSSRGTIASDSNWIAELEMAVLNERRRRARWRMGWECFRSTCSWLDVRIDRSKTTKYDEHEDIAVMHLGLALDGRLGEAPGFLKVLKRLQTCRWAVLSGMIEDWRVSFRVFGMSDDDNQEMEKTLGELGLLCAYARMEKVSIKIETALRQELVTVFTVELVAELLVSRLKSPVLSHGGGAGAGDILMLQWSRLTSVKVLEDRLRVKHYENLCTLLQEMGLKEDNEMTLWVQDAGLAYLFYQEYPGTSLSLSEWYECFALEIKNQEDKIFRERGDERRIKSRFVRAFCTLRHWGFLKDDTLRDQEQDILEKLVFL